MNNREHYDIELKEMSNALILMGTAATNAIDKTMTALKNRDHDLAHKVISDDEQIDEMERHIEQRCLRLLLRQQPVASDLRKVSTAIKMITDIERIGDAAADIAEISLHLNGQVFPEILKDVEEMAIVARTMVSDAIEAYVKEDLEFAHEICRSDDIVDNYFIKIRGKLGGKILSNTTLMEMAMDYLMIVKYLERIGDHAENICEWVEFSKTGIHKKGHII
jgi:phosphate transport system protein